MKFAMISKVALALPAAVFGAVMKTASPVERVVILLKDIQTKMENDGKVEQQVYDKFACWCEKTSLRKAQAIEKAQEDLRALGQDILKFKATVNVRTAEIATLEKEIKANKKEQADATQVRTNQNGAYTAEVAEMKQAIASLQQATQVIVSGAMGFLQTGYAAAAQKGVHNVMAVLPGKANIKPENIALLMEFAHGRSSYAPQSATIQGILKDMYETFVTDLESATMTEATQNREFETFISIKAEELAELEATKATKEAEKAEAEAALAETTQSYDDTEAQKKADIEFFDTTKSSCDAKHKEWVIRDDLRTEEEAGIDEALKILTSDEARQLFATAIQPGQGSNQMAAPSLLQVNSVNSGVAAAGAARAYTSLKAIANSAHSLRLARIAAQIRLAKAGHFEAVIKAIDEMIVTLKEEGMADQNKRDQCVEEYKNTDSVMAETKWMIERNQAKIDKLQALIDKHTATKEETIALIAATEKEIEEMKAQRDSEHQAFLQAKSDDEGAIALLVSATEAMSKFYKKNDIDMGKIQESVKASLIQQHKQPEFEVSADQAPTADFSGKGARKNESKGIVSMLTMIKEDLEHEIKNGQEAEASAQLEFEAQLKAAEKLVEDLTIKKENLETEIARLEGEKSDEHETMEGNQKDLKDETDYRAKITPDCDWIIGAFTKRGQARTAEMNGLESAKEHLVTG